MIPTAKMLGLFSRQAKLTLLSGAANLACANALSMDTTITSASDDFSTRNVSEDTAFVQADTAVESKEPTLAGNPLAKIQIIQQHHPHLCRSMMHTGAGVVKKYGWKKLFDESTPRIARAFDIVKKRDALDQVIEANEIDRDIDEIDRDIDEIDRDIGEIDRDLDILTKLRAAIDDDNVAALQDIIPSRESMKKILSLHLDSVVCLIFW